MKNLRVEGIRKRVLKEMRRSENMSADLPSISLSYAASNLSENGSPIGLRSS